MAMAMDDEVLPQGHWSLQLRIGEAIKLIPGDNEALWVTDVFLVDPESANGQGVVEACVKIGTKDIMLAELSSEVTDVELLDPEVLDKEFCFYVVRPGGDSDTHTDANANADAIVVQFEGFMFPMPSPDTEEGKEEEEAEEEEEEGDDEVEPDVARASSAGGNTKDVLLVAARIFVRFFLFVCVLALLRFIMSP